MKAVIQRVFKASVAVDGSVIGSANEGIFVLLGLHENDTIADAELLAKKVAALRIFCDENDKMNLSVLDISGDALVVSNFTLCADTSKGNRPSYMHSMEPNKADELYRYFTEQLLLQGVKNVSTGEFGADMKISAELNGPVTIVLDTDTWRK